MGGRALRRSAFFEPRGLLGFLYWYLVFPFHALIFSRMASRIVLLAEQSPRASALAAQLILLYKTTTTSYRLWARLVATPLT